jgi:hypothetical protein
VSDVAGEIAFYCGPPEHSGVASLRALEGAEQTTVSTVSGDEAISGVARIDLIKIDVEGAETRVIRGLHNTLARDKPDLIVEVSHIYLQQAGSSGPELCNTIMEHGYRMFQIAWEGTRECHGWSDALPDQFNAVFTASAKSPA